MGCRISVVTVCYNAVDCIEQTMLSVLDQTYHDIEYIIIDGGSTDGTVDIIKKYADRLAYWISEPDKGIYDAMNKGIAMASGDIIGILNSDDFFTADTIVATLAAELADQEIDAVYADVHYVDDSDLSRSVRYYSSRTFRPWMMKLGFQPAHPTFYCRKSVYDRHGSFDINFRVAADFEHLLRLIYIQRIPTRYIPLDCVAMRTGGASTSGLKSHLRILSDHLKAYRKNGVNSNLFLDASRYVYKVGEVLNSKVRSIPSAIN